MLIDLHVADLVAMVARRTALGGVITAEFPRASTRVVMRDRERNECV